MLCAVADDDQAQGLVAFATEFGDAAGFDLLVVHVADARAPVLAEVGGGATATAQMKGRALLRSLGVDDDDSIVALGDPVQEILRLGRELDAALVVVGTRTRPTLRGLLSGTVSRTMATVGDRPVMVLGPEACRQLGGPVICGVADTVGEALPAVRLAVDLAARLSAPLTLLRALDLDPVDGETDLPYAAFLDAEGWAALKVTHRLLDRLGNGHNAHAVLRCGHPADELTALADDKDAAMIVVGCQGHGALRRLLEGSVSLRLCRRARRPVVIVPRRARAGHRGAERLPWPAGTVLSRVARWRSTTASVPPPDVTVSATTSPPTQAHAHPAPSDGGVPTGVQHPTTRRGSLAWRVFVTNATILVVVGAGLVLTPLTVSHPVAATEAAILVAGLALTLLVNLALVRRTFAPLGRLSAVMDRVDLLRPGARVDVEAATPDVDALARAFNAMLERLENERRDSARRAVMAQEAERLRIGRELHDELGQALTGVLLQLDQAVRAHPGEPELQDARETARTSLELVRRLARDLRPDALDDLGLTSGLMALCSGFTRQTGIEVEHELPNDLPPLSREVDIVVYRVAQEALTNVARHADATLVRLRVSHRAGSLAMTVEDDGRGLPPGEPEGTGIRGMRERAMLANGRLITEPRAGGGVCVHLHLPIPDPE